MLTNGIHSWQCQTSRSHYTKHLLTEFGWRLSNHSSAALTPPLVIQSFFFVWKPCWPWLKKKFNNDYKLRGHIIMWYHNVTENDKIIFMKMAYKNSCCAFNAFILIGDVWKIVYRFYFVKCSFPIFVIILSGLTVSNTTYFLEPWCYSLLFWLFIFFYFAWREGKLYHPT